MGKVKIFANGMKQFFPDAKGEWITAGQAIEYADTQLSKVTAEPITAETLAERWNSCHTCPQFLSSKTIPGAHICGACGCGERKILEREMSAPRLRCELKRPGFYGS